MQEGDQQARIFAALPEKYHPFLFVGMRLGLRPFEVAKLEWPDIDWGSLRIAIEGKGGSRKSVPLATDVRDVLHALPRRHEKRVFAHEDGSPMTYSGVASAWKRAMRAAGVEGLRLYDATRHTAATRLLSKSQNIRLAQKLLRHRDLRSTLRYAHALDQDLRDALEATASPGITPGKAVKPLK
jgi:integrase